MTNTQTMTPKTNHYFVALLTLAMMASLLVAMVAEPAHAAFPGKNGKIVFASNRTTGAGVNNPEGDLEVFTMNPDGTGLKQLTNNTTTDTGPTYSPDGKKIAFASGRAGDSDIFVMNSDGSGTLTNLTSTSASDSDPAYSPDGQRLAFFSFRDGNAEIHTVSSSGSSIQSNLTNDPASDFAPDWQPLANTFTVNTTGDLADVNVGDGMCDVDAANGTPCTLRAAIEEANASAVADTIKFNGPEAFRDPGSGVATIKPASGLPPIRQPVTIDGYTQSGSSPNTLAKGTNAKIMVELDGSAAGSRATGLEVRASNSVIKGLAIDRFFDGGIWVLGNDNRVEGNFIGTDPSGTQDLGNGGGLINAGGMFVSGESNIVGNSDPAARNLISGNTSVGIFVAAGTLDLTPSGNKVLGNLIGTQKDGTSPLGNSGPGVLISSAVSSTTVGEASKASANVIAFNGGHGVSLDSGTGPSGTGNAILQNSIYSNAGLGIDLGGDGPTANDFGDLDNGANSLQNKPVITSARTSAGNLTIQGELESVSNQVFVVRFFSNPRDTNEGKKFIGQKTLTTTADGLRTFTFSQAAPVLAGQNITATATRISSGDTSEFSAPRKVVAS